MTAPKKAWKLTEAAAIAGVSVGTLRKAIKSTDDKVMPHLKAKFLGGQTGYIVLDAALTDWLDRLPDA